MAAKDAEISRLRKGLIDAEVAIKSQESLNALPFSAGITNSGLSPYMIIGKLESEVEQQMMSRIFCVHGFDNLMMNSTQNPQRLMRTLLQVQGKHINNHRILRIEEYLNSFVRSTRKFWTGKELALMKEQEFPTIGGLMAMMILIFLMDLLILTDLLGLLIHLVCLRFEDHRGIQQLIWSL